MPNTILYSLPSNPLILPKSHFTIEKTKVQKDIINLQDEPANKFWSLGKDSGSFTT